MLDKYIESLQNESDRGSALIGAELLSSTLRLRLEKSMDGSKALKKELLSGLGPISTFSSRIKVSYCFKVISRSTFQELNHLRAIRNIAAHSIQGFSFESQESQKHLSAMHFLDDALVEIENGRFTEELGRQEIREAILIAKNNNLFSGREKYNYTVALLQGILDV